MVVAARPSDVPPSTAQVATAVSAVRASGRPAVSRWATAPAAVAVPMQTAA